jgi:hypothetical protein
VEASRGVRKSTWGSIRNRSGKGSRRKP